MARLKVKLNASLRRYLPEGADGSPIDLEVADGTTVAQVVEKLGIPLERAHMVVADDEQLDLEAVVADGQELNLYPPLAGGC
jgi:molybdopterin converting factor small subunit